MEVVREYPPTAHPRSDLVAGTVWTETVASGLPPSRLRVLRVYLTPGARTCWHRHPLGQVLQVLAGRGLVQDREGPVRSIRAGDTVISAPGVWHWHGAGPDHMMTHLAMHETGADGTDATWGEHVTDAEYSAHPED